MAAMHHALKHALAITFAAYTALSSAQQVYRCESGGHVSYSHEPCLGAQAIDTTPTQGLDKWTGKTQQHRDIRNENFQRGLAQAIRPITGLSPEEFKVSAQRQKLSASDQLHCKLLDQRLPSLTRSAAQASPARKSQAEAALYEARQQFRDLRC